MSDAITLQMIRDQRPCKSGWEKLIATTGQDMTTVVSIGDIVLINGLDDALWTLRCLPPRQRVAAIMPAVRRASAHTSDPRVIACIASIQQWLDGDDTVDLEAAWAAARAAWAAARAAADAADAADAAKVAAEREAQRHDLLTMFPPVFTGASHE